MEIHFYLLEDDIPITSFYNFTNNPFTLGDIIHLDVNDVKPSDYTGFNEQFKENLIKNNITNKELFNRTKIQIVKQGNYVKINPVIASVIIFEYHCVFVNE